MSSLLDKLRFNRFMTGSVDRFEGENFVLTFPANWRQVRKWKNFSTADFINTENDHGIFQISSYAHQNPAYVYDLDKAREKLEHEGFKPITAALESKLEVLMYTVKFDEGSHVQYRFEVGSGRYRLFATLTFRATEDDTKDMQFSKAIDILQTLEFKN